MPAAVPEEITEAIAAALERDPRVDIHHSSLKVWAEEGTVVLDGMVKDIASKRRGHALAEEEVAGRWRLLDLVRVLPGEEQADEELRDQVAERLSTEPVFSEYTLQVGAGGELQTLHEAGPEGFAVKAHVHDGVVTLSGRVGSLSHRRLAEVLAWWTDGCTLVRNELDVFPEEADNDNEVTDAVRIVLEKDPLVHADNLRPGTAAGVVTLTGSVASEEEKRLAMLDAWYVPGVFDVVDRIDVHG
ncbi:MAG TPA: BON domain-containing protein [Gammaproteobacteria bacterium]|nr:BON domain-containing protein [Gammaproteobacteria bacterium]